MGRALLIIDMQESLLPVIWRGEELADRIAVLAQSARDEGIPVIATQQTGPVGSPFDPEDRGRQLSSRPGMQEQDLRVRKSATDGFYCTNLADVLAARDVDTGADHRRGYRLLRRRYGSLSAQPRGSTLSW